MNLLLVIPTYNGGDLVKKNIESLQNNIQFLQNILHVTVLLIDSSSTDGTHDYLSVLPFKVLTIPPQEFNHGRTRNLCLTYSDKADIIVFMTQDAILNTSGSLNNIVKIFENPDIALAYGRQIPHFDANPLAAHARFYNYKVYPYIADKTYIKKMGLKTIFNSNSFAAYRVSSFQKIGGFECDVILGEDMCFAARAIQAGYKIAYVPDAEVRHSHNYSLLQEFKRYFDIGVFHCQQDWIRKEFGGAGNEGKRFVISELKFLLKNAPMWIPRAILANFLKLAGYKLGQHHSKLPNIFVTKMSMHKKFWDRS